MRVLNKWVCVSCLVALGMVVVGFASPARAQCERTISADVVAFDQPYFYNRLGALNPAGMIYALRSDVVPISGTAPGPGNARLRPDKRPRPMVLRMNVGDCLQINFQNFLAPAPVDDEQPATRTAGVHVIGMQLVGSIASDASNVGTNANSLVPPGGSATYTLFAEREGAFLLYSTAATTGGEGDGGQMSAGLYGGVTVEPRGAEWYRSQVTAADMALATVGTTPAGQPIIDYNAVYPAGHAFAGVPILNMLRGTQIVHTDLYAVITGPNHGRFPPGTFPRVKVLPDREQPFREFTVFYHDEIIAVQAFPIFEDPVFSFTLHSARDAFALNYGTGGIGAEILANRFGVGPQWDCTGCKYEEFFLTSWAVGDPAMVVDIPANTTDASGQLIVGPKATKALFSDDPSNVHHAYMNDHVKFRIVHGGEKEHHIHHQHTHQWLHTPDDDNSAYLDSQALGPGSSFTLEMVYNGSGNRNKAPGDSIFHCHFYPHFAMGMWSLWRVHDVFEAGTVLDAEGRPVAGARVLPDGEIAVGTPIPALVPLPTLPMAPMPTAEFPGYPLYIPGVAGHRPPKPPLDMVDDGGLPRHVLTGGTAFHVETRLDFTKELEAVTAVQLPEEGTPLEQAAMVFHEQRRHASFTPEGTAADFIANGLPRVAGAPYAEPCVDDDGNAIGNPRIYKAAVIQFDAKINKSGWHFPQQRIETLWGDVAATISGQRPPEPLFMRANTNDCITFFHSNLVPNIYELDDFQVRTPTDVMGQHIHLVKFDVMASDGAANGWNYEDGSHSPDETIERIHAIRHFNQCTGLNSGDTRDGTFTCPVAQPHPFFGVLGAQTTIQRWLADDVLNLQGEDRTLRTVFTHDHYGPSTHQQAGLYAGLVVEPEGSVWRNPDTGEVFGGRFDGGPTSWRADILTPNPADSYREFMFEFQDFALAYNANAVGFPDPANAINPPGREEVGLPFLLARPVACPGGVPPPCPEAISADDPGTMTANYRNEPVSLRVRDPGTNQQAGGNAGDLAFAFSSRVNRADPALNTQPNFYPPLTGGVEPADPFTPLLRAYENDRVQVRVLVGAHEEGHNFSIHGVKWLFEPSASNSGWRNSQMMGISEHFEFLAPLVPIENQNPAPGGGTTLEQTSSGCVSNDTSFTLQTTTTSSTCLTGGGGTSAGSTGSFSDHLYKVGSSVDDLWNGLWGLLRVYHTSQQDLLFLPSNPDLKGSKIANKADFIGPCPATAVARSYDITALSAQVSLPEGTLVYNQRTTQGGRLHDPTAILFADTATVNKQSKALKNNTPLEPLILRANAGDCVVITLRNQLLDPAPDLDGFSTLPMIVDDFNANQIRPSSHVGLHSQLLAYNVDNSDGTNVGFNSVQTIKPNQQVTYRWYAGDLKLDANNNLVATPVEFGAVNLSSADPIKHSNKGAIAGLVIEPAGSTWSLDRGTRASATVTPASGASFREFVLLFQDDINMRRDNGAVPNLAESEDPEDSGQSALNYRTEPLWKRMGFEPDTPLEITRTFDFTNSLSNSQVGGEDPVTPVFTATVGTPVRFRVLEPAGHQRNHVFQVHGHIWQEEPYILDSTRLGFNPLSEWKGAQMGHGASNHFDALLLNGAGGKFKISGDYLYRDHQSFRFDGGLWGIFRVTQ